MYKIIEAPAFKVAYYDNGENHWIDIPNDIGWKVTQHYYVSIGNFFEQYPEIEHAHLLTV